MSSQRFQDVYKLSPTQEGMLFHSLMGDTGAAYIEQISLDCRGNIDVEILEQSFDALLERYDILRTVFQYEDLKHPLQIVLRRRKMKIHFQDISDLDSTGQTAFLEDYKLSVRQMGFDLSRDLLLKIALFKTGGESYSLVWSSHHIVMDGWCLGIVFKDLLTIYTSLKNGDPHGLPPVTPYKKYIQWLDTQKPDEAARFWKDYLDGYERTAGFLPADDQQEPGDYSLREYHWRASDELSRRLGEIAAELQVTVNTIFQTIWGILLQNHNVAVDVVFGSVVSGRPPGIPGIETMVGLFVNTVPMRIQTYDGQRFDQLARNLHERASASKPYEFVPLAETQAHTSLRDHLFDHLVSFQNFPIQKEIKEFSSRGPGFSIEGVHVHEQTHYDLNVLVGFAGNLTVNFNYNARLYPDSSVWELALRLERLLEQVADDCRLPVMELEIILADEKKRVLEDLNSHTSDFPVITTIPELFRQVVSRYPDHPALLNGFASKDVPQRVTYREMGQAVSRIAAFLQGKGIGPDSIVALRFRRSFDMVVAIFGILEAGGAYLPIDPAYPRYRALYMLNDSNARLLLADDVLDHRELDATEKIEIVTFSAAMKVAGDAPVRDTGLKPGDLAYVIYTSGTTGKPKGSLIQHNNVVSLMFHQPFPFDFSHHDVWTLFHSYCFDFSVWEIFGALLYGGGLVVISPDVARDPCRFLDILEQRQVTVLNQTPSSFYNIVAQSQDNDDLGLSLRYVIFGGEALKPSRLEDWRHRFPEIRFINMYGITETTVHVTFKEIQEADIHVDSKSIGIPLASLKVLIASRNLKPLPAGVPGEILVSGAGVCRGYLNRPELTAEKFCGEPLLYRSGDKGRLTVGGDLEYFGRIDTQVKIRGYRIEPDEIEAVLRRCQGVDDALVRVMTGNENDRWLCAYVIPGHDLESIRAFMGEKLPSYMIPSYFVPIQAFPITSNGKLDVRALPDPLEYAPTPSRKPKGPVETALAAVWSKVLGVDKQKIGINSDFFQLGGHSLKITRLSALIHKELSIKIPLPELFNRPTIARQAEYITGKDGGEIFQAIQPAEKRDFYPCSSAQRRLLFLQLMEPETVVYNIPCVMMVERPLNLRRLQDVFAALIKRHESFRTSFLLRDGAELSQRVHDAVDFALESFSFNDEADDMSPLIHRFIRPFDLASPPLFRVGTAQMGENRYLLMMDVHHVIADGVSMNILMREFMTLYAGGHLPPLSLQYKDYSLWQNSGDHQREQSLQKGFWKMQFADRVPVLELPLDHPRPHVQSFSGSNVMFQAPAHTVDALLSIASAAQATPYMAFLSVFYVLLSKLSGQEDIVVGTPVSGRGHADFDSIVGMFVNTLPLRNEPVGDKTFAQFLDEVRDNTIAAFDNQQFPFEEMVECLEVERDTSRNPLFDVVFSLQNFDDGGIELPPEGLAAGDFAVRPLPFKGTVSKFDLTLTTRLLDDGATFSVEYCTALFSEETIARFAGYYLGILSFVAENPDICLDEIEIMPEEERKQVLELCNAPVAPFPHHETLHHLFARQAKTRLESIAVTGPGEECLTYKELDENSSRLGYELQLKGVTSDSIVGVMANRSLFMIVSILGILKAGGAYMPIDPNYPPERISYMLSDSAAALLVTQEDLPQQKELSIDKVYEKQRDDGFNPDTFKISDNKPEDLAYVIYTSGTTGKPKGSLIQHNNVVSLMFHKPYPFEFSQDDVWTLFHSYCFDFSVWEMYGALLYGGRLVMISSDAARDPGRFLEILERERVTVLNQTPSSFYNVMTHSRQQEELDLKLRYIIFGGEALKPSRLEYWRDRFRDIRFINMYGITETTVHVTFKEIDDDDIRVNSPSIGAPLSTLNVLIAGRNLRLVPVGVPGEILVSGAGVCRGYLNRPELTAERFSGEPRLYRSGDRGRLTSSGDLEYFGRIDTQVKIRGYRIEPEEIEAVLRRCQGVDDALVRVMAGNDNDRWLCAYVIPGNDLESIRSFLAERLPPYMIPSYFVPIQAFPITANGKLDVSALPDPLECAPTPSQEPKGPVETALAAVWSQVLEVDKKKIGINSDFFQLGGHSLKVTRLSALIHKELSVKIPLPELFNRPTIARQAEYITGIDEAETFQAIYPAEKQDYYVLSPNQKRFYFLQQLERDSIAYNISQILPLEGLTADKQRLEDVMGLLIQRHEALRTSFADVNHQPVQRIHDTIEFRLEMLQADKSRVESVVRDFIRPFDLSQAPLLRAAYLEVPDSKPRLILDIHHIIADGTSMKVLIRDFLSILDGQALEPLKIHYKDVSVWQEKQRQSGDMAEHESFWMRRLNAPLPVLAFPTDFPRPAQRSHAGQLLRFTAGKELFQLIQQLEKHSGATLYMILLAALNILFFRYTRQEDIIVGSPIAARFHADLESIIGLMIGSVMMRNAPNGTLAFSTFLQQVKTNTLEAFQHQAYPFEEILERVDYPDEPGRNPISDIGLIVQNMIDPAVLGSSDESGDEDFIPKTSKLDVTLIAAELEDDIFFMLEYSTELFLPETIDRLSRHLLNILASAAKTPSVTIDAIDMLADSEKIDKIGRAVNCYPLSQPQQRVLDTERVYAGTSVNTLAFTVRYDDTLDPLAVRMAVNHVLRHNDGLRLRPLLFDVQTGQYVAPHQDVELEILDFNGDEQALNQWLSVDTQKPFGLDNDPLCYFAYIKYSSSQSGYYVKFHHLVGDGWTAAMVFEQIDEAMQTLASDDPPLSRETRSYTRFISQEADYLQSAQYKVDRDYWLKKITPLPEPIDLATGQPVKDFNDIRSRVMVLDIDGALREKMFDFCRRRGVTLFKLFLSALVTIVGRVTGNEDVVIGSAGHNRGTLEQKETMGMFVSTILLRLTLTRDMNANAFLNEIDKELMNVVKNHQRYPFQQLLKDLRHQECVAPDHLLDINLIGHGVIQQKNYRIHHHFAGYDPSPLTIHINSRDSLDLEWVFRPGLYPDEEILALHRSMITIIEALMENEDVLLWDIPLVPEEESRKLCRQWSEADAVTQLSSSIMDALDTQAKLHRDRVAVVADDRQTAYGCLFDCASQLAGKMLNQGVGGESVVAVMTEPSLEMMAGLLGILKSGAAYLPISPQYPDQRVSFMLRDSQAKLLLIDGTIAPARIDSLNCPVLRFDASDRFIAGSTVSQTVDSSSPAYIIYTSGSTGRPKGVVTSRSNLEAYLNAFFAEFNLTPSDTVIQQAAFTFDAFVEEFYPTLLVGGRLAIPRRDVAPDAEKLARFIAKHSIGFITCSPLLLNELNYIAASGGGESLRTLRIFISGGDVLRKDYVSELMRIGAVYNTYGPTETTVCATYQRCTEDVDAHVPIGSSIKNYKVAIIDPQSNLLPAGLPGEIIIGGPGLANGYLNRPELTAETFIARRTPGFGEITLYRSGDRGVVDPAGVVRFLGRIDRQVKIRGYRIELAEIEHLLLQHPAVRDAAVAVHKVNDDPSLCAYIVGKNSDVDWRGFLERILPSYMIPLTFSSIGTIPRTPGGKVDRDRLPKPETLMDQVITPPRNDVEEAMLDIWAGLLGVESQSIGVDSNFFEAGGHSLKATRLVHRLNKRFDSSLELRDIFSYPTIRQLAQRVGGSGPGAVVSIVNVEKEECYDLSYAQRRLWILCQFEEDSTAYNMPGAFFFMGGLDLGAFREAIRNLAARHESLRTTFIMKNGIPKQRIIDAVDFALPVEVVDLRHLEADKREAEGRRKYIEIANSAFDLERGPLFLFKLLRMDEGTYLVVFNIHHIINDGWSQGIINRDLAYFYNLAVGGDTGDEELAPLPLQYKDYAAWHNRMIQDQQFHSCGRYWLEKLKDKPTGLELPTDFPRPPIQTFNGKRLVRIIDARQSAQLEQMCVENGATLFMGLMNLLSIFLHRYTGGEDILIGAPIAGRSREELQPLVGFLVNTLVYRFAVSSEASFIQLLEAARQETLDCYRYQDYPFDLLVEELGLERDLSSSPLFNVMLAHNNTINETRGLNMEGVSVDGFPHTADVNISKFDLIFFLDEMEQKIFLTLEYNTDLFMEETIRRMADNFTTLVAAVLSEPREPVRALPLLHPDERHMVTRRFNGDRHDFPKLTVPQMFIQKAETVPDRVAVVHDHEDGKSRVTYHELLHRARRLAHYLVQHYNVRPGSIVGVSLDRSIEMVVALWGIMISGAGYVAIDPNYPPERIGHILEDSDTRLIVTDNGKPHLLEQFTGEKIVLPDAWKEMPATPEGFQPPGNRLEDILYVIYTSGSTGTPNGALLSHGILSNLIQWQHRISGIDEDLRCLQFTSVNFCVSFQEIAGTLTGGGQVHLIGDVQRQDIGYLMEFLDRQCIELLYLPFSYLNFLFNQSDRVGRDFRHSLKHIVTAGEQLKITAGLKHFLDANPHLQLHNHYGSSEMHVVSSYSMDGKSAAKTPVPPAGTPVANTDIFILDDGYNPVPVGVWGELCIAGSHEVLGYINNRELTNKKLLFHPQLSSNGKRLYLSGDLGRWLPDGNIEIKGRKDLQVKIRGFRIELGEVESRILAIDGVKECVVAVKDLNSGGGEYGGSVKKELLGYVVLEGIDVEHIKRVMASQVPKYMIPVFVRLELLPLMPNGKVDRERLPEPDLSEMADYVAPTDPAELDLVEIWSDILKLPASKIGVNSDFFQLGGHSLNATIMVSRIYQRLNVRLPLTEVFKAPTIAELSGLVKTAQKEMFTSAGAVEKRDFYPCSSAQRRLLFLQHMEPETVGYNIPGAIMVEGPLDLERLSDSFAELVKRHESFRTSFLLKDGKEPVQRIHHNVEFTLESISFNNEADDMSQLIHRFIRPFDLASPPLLRVGTAEIERHRFLLMMDMHHVIADGVSMSILVREFMTLYAGGHLPSLALHYKDYSLWQNSGDHQIEQLHQKNFWLAQFADGVPALDLPLDYPRPQMQSFEGCNYMFQAPAHTVDALLAISSVARATPYMAFLSVFYILLSKLGGQEDIVVGTPVSGRVRADFDAIIGMFVNTLPLRNEPIGDKRFAQFMKEVRDNTIAAFDNQQFPFEEMVECLEIERDTSRNPLFDVVFSLQNFDDGVMELPPEGFAAGDFTIRPFSFKGTVSKFDLTLTARLLDDGATFNVEYCTALFSEETIARFAGYFLGVLSVVTEYPDIRLDEIEIIPEEEKTRALELFNAPIAPFPHHETLHQLFARQAKARPEAIAVTGPGEERLTYRELDENSSRLAYELQLKGVTSDSIVGVMADRSLFMVVSILGILKAGGAYMPIDPNYPGQRVSYMLADSAAAILVTQEDLPQQQELPIEKVYEKHLNGGFDPDAFEISDNAPEDLAYVIYTSGTTGKPKGSLIQHNNVVSLMFHQPYPFEFSSDDVWTLFHSYCFDFSVWEMYGALLYGGRLVMVSSDVARDPGRFLELLEQERVTVLNQTPSSFYNLMAQSRHREELKLKLRYIIFGGEALKPSRLEYWRNRFRDIRFINMYGITETTVHVTFKEIDDQDIRVNSPSIGTPLSTLNVLIAGRNFKPIPVGVPGEMLVSGAGVCRGYLNRPELTAEKFPGEPRLYRSGDQGRLTASGELEYFGRIDQQVKIRGYRIEPKEIEAVLRRHPEVDDALVRVIEGDEGDRWLCAYVIPGNDMDSIRRFMEKNLPPYMLPSYFVPLESFPLTPNGKLDVRELPGPLESVDSGSRNFEDPVEETIAGIFAKILNIDVSAIGRDSSFFELGGHSLKALSLANDIHRELKVKLSIHAIFQASTVRLLAQEINAREKTQLATIPPLEPRDYYELSYTQKRMWVIQTRDSQSAVFNMPDQIAFTHPLDVELVKRSFYLLASRHEALRTYLKEVDGVMMQAILPEVGIPLEYLDLSDLSEENLRERLESIWQFESETGFDLYQAPLLRVRVIKISDNDWHIMFNIHHLVSDGWSMEVLKQDLLAMYETLSSGKEPELEALEIQYKDYAHWHNRMLEDQDKLKEVLSFWRNHLSGQLPVLNLPYDFSPNQLKSHSGAAFHMVLSEETTGTLNELARRQNCSYFMVMLAAVNLLLSQLREQDDILIGLPGAAREHPGLRQTVGLFVNTLVLRTRLDRDTPFLELLENVKGDTMKVLEYQGYPLEMIVDELGVEYPKFPMFFNMLNMADNSEVLPDHRSFHLSEVQDAKFDLEFYIKEYSNGTVILCSYFSQLFLPETIEKITARFVAILEKIAANPKLPLREYRGVKKKPKVLKKTLSR